MIKRISAILILTFCSLPFLLASCVGNTAPPDDTGQVSETAAEALKIVEGGVSPFRVVYPENPGAEFFSHVTALVDAIKNETGARLETASDFIGWSTKRDPEAREILIGATNYDESAEALSQLRIGDYTIRAVGNKIVIAAHTSETVGMAVNYFCKNLIKKNIVTGDDGKIDLLFEGYTYMSTPAVESLTIGGADVSKFRIIYAASPKGCEVAAASLCNLIAKRCGYMLSVSSDVEAEPAEHEILVGPTNRRESADFAAKHPAGLLSYSMGVERGKFVINAGAYTSGLASQRFSAKYLFSGSGGVSIPEGEIVSYSFLSKTSAPLADGADLRIMTANILAEFPSWGAETSVYERAEIFASLLEVYSPDVAGIQEITPQWDEMIPYYSGGEYAFLHMKTPDGLVNYSTIIYKKNKFNVRDSGVTYFSTEGKNNIRLVTWGVFEDKNSGECFIVFNTHWCWDTEEHARIQAAEEAALIKQVTGKYDYPYFCTADYNTKQDTANYKYFLELTGAVDAKYAARDAGALLNISGGCGALGTPRGESGNSIDHIFMSPSIKIFAFETVVVNQTWDLSDHSPKYCDVKLK